MGVSLERRWAPIHGIRSSFACNAVAVLALVFTMAAPAMAAEATHSQETGPISSTAPNIFLRQAGELRVNTCAGLYAALGNAAAEGSSYTARTEADRTAPDVHPVHGTVGMTYNLPNMKGQAAALISAAPAGGKCEGQFVRIAPFQISCSQILRDFPKGSQPIGNLSGVPLYQLGGVGGQALTIPNGDSCIVISIVQGQQKL